MLTHLSVASGIGGKLKSEPGDFLVEEIAQDGTIFELGRSVSREGAKGPFTHFVLQKRNWATSSAISEIAKRLGASHRNFNTAGTKDKLAITSQLASVRGDWKQPLLDLKIRDISILGAWGANGRVHMGQLLGNRFAISVRGARGDATERAAAVSEELGGMFPNYFGEQRFGSTRRNTHLVGEKLLRGETEEALLMFLCDSEGEENPEAREARKELRETRDYSRALGYFPKHLRLERSLIAQLAIAPKNPSQALRRLPRNILLLFIHAFQSHIFNTLLSERIREGTLGLEEGEYFCGETLGFPDISKTEGEGWICGKLIGYGTPLNAREKSLLDELEIGKDAFRMGALPEIASKGTYRTLLAPLRGLEVSGSEPGDSDCIRFRFSLPSGSYATVAMREFMDE